jgi:undecaprenyl-diphosphatase
MLAIIIEAIILGFVQGATEFIPISSSAHLIIIPWLFGWTDPALTSLSFDVALHLGTLVALLAYFARDWVRLAKGFYLSIRERRIGEDPDRRLAWMVILATVPGGLAGWLLESRIEALFHTPGVPIPPSTLIIMAAIIGGFGVLLLLSDFLGRQVENMEDLNVWKTLLIGVSQAIAVFPGVSRSGATISTGLALGLNRESATRFSFMLSAPIIAGAGIKSIVNIYSGVQAGALVRTDLIIFPVGFLMAALTGFYCIRFLLRYLQENNLNIFVYYRWALAVLILVVALIAR